MQLSEKVTLRRIRTTLDRGHGRAFPHYKTTRRFRGDLLRRFSFSNWMSSQGRRTRRARFDLDLSEGEMSY